jgi:hypothetical protein
VEHKTLLSWLAIAHIGAAYKNQEGSLASWFRRCSTWDVTTMNIRNGNSNSAAAPLRPLDPMESEEWSATSVYAFLFVHYFIMLSTFSGVLIYYFPSSFILCSLYLIPAPYRCLQFPFPAILLYSLPHSSSCLCPRFWCPSRHILPSSIFVFPISFWFGIKYFLNHSLLTSTY